MAGLHFEFAFVSILAVVAVHVESGRFGGPALGLDYVDSYGPVMRSYEGDAYRAHRSRPTGRPTTSLGKSCNRPSWRLLVDNEPMVPCDTEHPSCRFRHTCGLAPLNPLPGRRRRRPYIARGQNQAYGEWPSFARVYIDGFGYCGGVLVSDRHVLASVSCLGNASPSEAYKSVIVAEHRLVSDDEFEREVPIESVCAAKEYASDDRFDWALITLKEPVEFNCHVQPACLPFEPIDRTETGLCYVVGVGKLYHQIEGDYPEVVQKFPIKRVSCQSELGISDSDVIQECYRAAGSGPRAQTYSLDSGSPILCLDKNSRWTVVGLARRQCCFSSHHRHNLVFTKLRTQSKNIKTQCDF
jgi:hypothetical protein